MHWKIKARIQNAAAALPPSLSGAAYLSLQLFLGRLRRFDTASKIRNAVGIWERIRRHGREPGGSVFFEVGTGHAPVVPISLWLMGAERTVTVDLNRYLRLMVIRQCLGHIAANERRVRSLFGPLLVEGRFRELLDMAAAKDLGEEEFLGASGIVYLAPCDAAATELGDKEVDFHVSCLVFEHIPPEILRGILLEGNRILADGGLFVHRIDYSDHFSHRDPSINSANFLQFSDEEWRKYAGNRFMYMNRLRHDDYLALFREAGHAILGDEPVCDERALASIESGEIRVDGRFAGRPGGRLAIKNAWIVSSPA